MSEQQLKAILEQLQQDQGSHEVNSLATKYKFEGAIEILTKIIAEVEANRTAEGSSL